MTFIVIVFALLQISATVEASAPNNCNTGEDANVMLQAHASLSIQGEATQQVQVSSVWNVDQLLMQVENMKDDPSQRNMTRIQEISAILMRTLLPELNKSRAAAEGQLKDAAKEYDVCNTDAGNEMLKVENMSATTSTAEASHADCRTEQKNKLGTMNTECEALDLFVNGLAYPAMPVSKDFTIVKAQLQSVSEWINAKLPLWVDKNRSCIIASKAHADETTLCEKNQTVFESDFCQYRQALLDLSGSAERCYSAADAIYQSMKADTDAAVSRWNEEYTALKKIECYLKVWLSDGNVSTVDQSVTDACQTISIDPNAMAVIPPVIPPAMAIDVTPVRWYPGTNEFLNRYESLPSYSSDVLPCMAHTVTTTTTTTTKVFSFKRCSSTSGYGGGGHNANELYLDANQGVWSSGAFCNTVDFGSKAQKDYHISVQMNNIQANGKVDRGHIGVGWNTQDMDNFDFVYFRPHSDGSCYQTGHMKNGQPVFTNGESKSCLGGGIRGGKWVTIEVFVGSTTAQIFKDGREVASVPSKFQQTVGGTMIVANGYENSALFKDFSVVEAKNPSEEPTYDVTNSMGQAFSVDKNVAKSTGQFASVLYSLAGRNAKVYIEFTRNDSDRGYGAGVGVQRAPTVIGNKHSGTGGNGNGGVGVAWYTAVEGMKAGVNSLLIDIDTSSASLNGAAPVTISGQAGSTLYLAYYDGTSSGTGEMTFNFGQSTFQGTLPAGAQPWCCQSVPENVPE